MAVLAHEVVGEAESTGDLARSERPRRRRDRNDGQQLAQALGNQGRELVRERLHRVGAEKNRTIDAGTLRHGPLHGL